MNITFIGTCQQLSLCFYFQQLLNSKNYNICWVSYNKKFNIHLGKWSDKCINKITNEDKAIQVIKDSDIIIYRNISKEQSTCCNTTILQQIKKISCKLINIPYIAFDCTNFDNSITRLRNCENIHNVDIKVSDLFDKFKDSNLKLMLKGNHPTTFLFMEIVKILCNLLNLDFFTQEQYNNFLKDENYMKLP